MNRPWTLERIYSKCRSEPGEPCQIWLGMAPEGYPRVAVRDPSYASGQRQIFVRRLVYELAKGRPAPSGRRHVLVAKCGHDLCVSEDCLQLITRSQLVQAVADTGAFASVKHRAAIAAGRRRSSHLTDEAIQQLRASAKITKEQAAQLGISRAYAYSIRSGRSRIDYTSPFAALQPGQCGRK